MVVEVWAQVRVGERVVAVMEEGVMAGAMVVAKVEVMVEAKGVAALVEGLAGVILVAEGWAVVKAAAREV